jgi:D-alanine-D-alanine ligase
MGALESQIIVQMIYNFRMDKTIAVLFGGRSPEHEVSIITGIQVLNALKNLRYNTLPIYVTKKGRWVLGDKSFYKVETFKDLQKAVKDKPVIFLPPDPSYSSIVEESRNFIAFRSFVKKNVDVFFPAFHGKYGEDGVIQGVFEMAGVAYVGCNVQASAIGMDKVVCKKIAKAINIPVLKDNHCTKAQWQKRPSVVLKDVVKGLKFPLFVKPARLGSSIGLKKVNNSKELKEALEVAFFYDTKIMVEQGLSNAKEINISLIGNNPYEYSACEQPIFSGDVLSFKDKYISKKGPSRGMASAKRIVPAPIKRNTESEIKKYSERFFAEIEGEGIARIDFLISKDEKKIYFNEINTMPGSVAFYLWEHAGVSFDKLVEKLIFLALERKENNEKIMTTFESNILKGFRGTKTSKC